MKEIPQWKYSKHIKTHISDYKQNNYHNEAYGYMYSQNSNKYSLMDLKIFDF